MTDFAGSRPKGTVWCLATLRETPRLKGSGGLRFGGLSAKCWTELQCTQQVLLSLSACLSVCLPVCLSLSDQFTYISSHFLSLQTFLFSFFFCALYTFSSHFQCCVCIFILYIFQLIIFFPCFVILLVVMFYLCSLLLSQFLFHRFCVPSFLCAPNPVLLSLFLPVYFIYPYIFLYFFVFLPFSSTFFCFLFIFFFSPVSFISCCNVTRQSSASHFFLERSTL